MKPTIAHFIHFDLKSNISIFYVVLLVREDKSLQSTKLYILIFVFLHSQPYLADLTMSELHTVLTSGFSTIAGTVMAAYISFGVSPGTVYR